MRMMYYWVEQTWPHMMWGGMWFWPLLLAGLGYLVWYSYRPRRRRYINEDPVEVARMRLARGEITVEEFERIREAVGR
jgi:uncharacterized membrane protein